MHILYRHYNNPGRLLYVGITNDPPQRLRDHRQGSEWWDLVATTTYERFTSRAELMAAEQQAIRTEFPIFNVCYNPVPGETPTERYDWVLNNQTTQPGPNLHPCPSCGKPSHYNAQIDRHVHFDGSENLTCWAACTQGIPNCVEWVKAERRPHPYVTHVARQVESS